MDKPLVRVKRCFKHGRQGHVHLPKLNLDVCPLCVRMGWFHPMVRKEYTRLMRKESKSFFADNSPGNT